MCDWLEGRTKVSRDIDQSQHPCMSRAGKRGIWRKSGREIGGLWGLFVSRMGENTEYISCRTREVQIPAKFCTSRTGKRPPSPKSHREVKETGVFCTSRMGKGNKSRIANLHQWYMHEKPASLPACRGWAIINHHLDTISAYIHRH